MPHAFADIARTPSVKATQQHDGSRADYARSFEGGTTLFNSRPGSAEADFIGEQRSFYMATVSETGWPYLQLRGGPRGFLKVPDDKALAFADYAGNRQLIHVGTPFLFLPAPSPLRSRGDGGFLPPANHPHFKDIPHAYHPPRLHAFRPLPPCSTGAVPDGTAA